MQILVVDTVRSIDRQGTTLVRVRRDGEEPWLLQAFEDEPPHFCEALDERCILVVGRDGGIGLFNAENRMAGPRQKLPMMLEHCMLSPDRRRLLAVCSDAVCVIDTRSLLPISVVHGLEIAQGSRIGLRDDGQIVVGHEALYRYGGQLRHGIYLIDPEWGKANLEHLESPPKTQPEMPYYGFGGGKEQSMPGVKLADRFSEPLIWVSPDGRWGLRRSYGNIPVEKWEESCQVGIALEVWSLAPTKLLRTLRVRMFDEDGFYGFVTDNQLQEISRAIERSASPTSPNFPLPQDPQEAEQLDAIHECCQRFLGRLVDVLWQPDASHAWLAFSDGCLRRISPQGTASPIFEILPDDPEHRLRAGMRAGSMRYLEDGRIDMRIAGVGQLLLDTRPWLEIRAPADATICLGGMAADSRDPDNAPPLDIGSVDETVQSDDQQGSPTAQERKHRVESVVVTVGESSAENCLAAIERLTSMVRENLSGLVHDGHMILEFDCSDGQLDEAGFFELVRQRCPDAAPALRALVEAFIKQVSATQSGAERIWGDERGTAALAHAAKALALMDAGAMEVFASFQQATSQQYDEFLWEGAVPDIFVRHDWPDRGMLRWGLVFLVQDMALEMREDGKLLDRAGLMEGAQRFLQPDEFVEMLLAVIRDEELVDGESGRDRILATFVLDYLEPIDDFRQTVRDILNVRF